MDGLKTKKEVVFLFSELSYYFLSGLNSVDASQASIHVVHWDVNPEAPFAFRFPEHVQFYRRSAYENKELLQLIEKINPELLFCAGWLDKGYLKIVKKLKGPKKVLSMDNQWHGNLRQQAARLAARFSFLSHFDAVWVPGEKQVQFAKKLGFKEQAIQTGFYSADLSYFNRVFEQYKSDKKATFPHVFLFLGRYAEEKGIELLIEAFEELKLSQKNDWKLLCAGTGKLRTKYQDTEDIKHLGFIQPYDLEQVMKQAGVFVLPSSFEPWGLVVHESAAAGLAIVCTKVVGSASLFVRPENGLQINPGNKEDLKQALLNMMQRSDDELWQMSEASHRLAQQISPAMWAEKLFSFLDL